MPGTPSLSSRQNIRFCKDEGYLDRASFNSVGFSQDLHIIRGMVQSGTLPENGVLMMEAQGTLSENQRLQLQNCLGRIATGGCPLYPARSSTLNT